MWFHVQTRQCEQCGWKRLRVTNRLSPHLSGSHAEQSLSSKKPIWQSADVTAVETADSVESQPARRLSGAFRRLVKEAYTWIWWGKIPQLDHGKPPHRSFLGCQRRKNTRSYLNQRMLHSDFNVELEPSLTEQNLRLKWHWCGQMICRFGPHFNEGFPLYPKDV